MYSPLTKQRLVTLALVLVGGIIVAGGTHLMFGADLRDRGNHEPVDLAAIGTASGSAAPGGAATNGDASTHAAASSSLRDRNVADSDGAGGGEVVRQDLVPSSSTRRAAVPVRQAGDSKSGATSTDVGVPTTRTDSTSKGGKTPSGTAGGDTTTDPPAVVDRDLTSGTKTAPSKPGGDDVRGPKGGGGTGGQVEQSKTVEITGSVSGLWPGQPKTLELKLENPNASLVRITEFAVHVAAASGSCTSEKLHSGDYPLGTTIPGRGERVVSVTVWLDVNAGNECAGATFPLTYSLKAEKA